MTTSFKVKAGAALVVSAGVSAAVAVEPGWTAAAAVAGTSGMVWWRYGRSGTRAAIDRWDRRTARHAGTASWWDITRTSSPWAMRRKARVLRPSLASAPVWRVWRAPITSVAVPLCTVGRRVVHTSVEESTLRIGIPGTGKTAELACRVLDAPGGAVVTSTATDLYDLTAPVRRKRGPVTVFNPAALGGLASTLRWSPLTGCTDPATAARRATDLVGPQKEGSEGERWAVNGRRVLAVLLHAAALGGYRMSDVAAWIASPDAATPLILTALASSPQARQMVTAARQALGTNPRTRDGVMLAISPAVAWTTLPSAADTGDVEPEQSWSVGDLIDRAGTLYLLGDEDGTVGPLLSALVAEIAHQTRREAAARPGGRLDPALALILDEVALTCRTPLPQWMAELRKRNIAVHAACQGLAQLRQVWGDDGASMILNCAAAVLVYGGCKDAGDLDLFARLAGEREEVTHTRDQSGRITSTSTRRVPVIAPAMLAGLPNHEALLIRRGMPVSLARTPIAWKRRDVRRAGRVAHIVREPAPAPAVRPSGTPAVAA
ncbi:type IV secretory system conjugative DNA transfer family protein [Catenuloplanes japonicus]|uniref:type IV secretory system conjugative DNA transfer family protein n=1 Tax=Catenuloplanes japonicus TaxID=33876 RepID=UPI000524747C|nr:TraM recognition domain-containing protein [Catenuloplanes japonicus]